jgi:RHS repeat-associated protein
VSGTDRTWEEHFHYDRFGNRTSQEKYVGNITITLDSKTKPTIDPNTNRFNLGQNISYDKNGNIIQDIGDENAVRTFIFNGDNKQKYVVQSGHNVGEYFYDGEGNRVRKVVYNTDGVTIKEETLFVYSAGKFVEEYSTKTPPTNPTTSYTATDQLGSPRVITDSNGNVISRRDFMPFGEEITNNIGERAAALNLKYGVADGVRQKFTGYQKDDETNLDFAEARMYENRHGRFTAVDPLLASGKSANPQSFNRYTYCLNNPLIFTDSNGLQTATVPTTFTGTVYVSRKKIEPGQTFRYRATPRKGYFPYTGDPRTITVEGNQYTISTNGVSGVSLGSSLDSPQNGIKEEPLGPNEREYYNNLSDELNKKESIAKAAGGAALIIGTGGGGALYLGSSLIAPTITGLGITGAEYAATHPQETEELSEYTLQNLPKVAQGFQQIYRGTASPNVTQVGDAYRSNPSLAPSGETTLATTEEAIKHMGAMGHPELVSASTNLGSAMTYGGSNGSIVVYNIPTNTPMYNNLLRLQNINPVQGEMFFKGSIPDIFRVATISK